MSTTYEQTTTTSSSVRPEIGVDQGYIRTIPGILKIVECVLDMIAFICASIFIWWGRYGGGWVQFVTISAFITTLVWFIFHLLKIVYRLPSQWRLIEFIYYCIYTVMLLIAAVVAAARGSWDASIGACAFFTFAATIVYAVDTFLMFKDWRSGTTTTITSGGGGTQSSTVVTTTEYETRTQY
ncbi:hypothetical protein ScPMuIL_000070 [Solemya velum]